MKLKACSFLCRRSGKSIKKQTNKANSLLVDTVSGKVENVTPESEVPQFFVMGGGTKDGKYLFGVSDRGTEFRKMVRMERATMKVEIITKDIPWDVDNVAVSKDMKKGALSVNEGGITRIYLMDMETLEYERVASIPDGGAGGLVFDTEGKRLFMNLSNARMNGDAFQLDLETMKLERWTQSDTAGPDISSFALPQLVHYPTFDKVDDKPRMIPGFPPVKPNKS